ncbi:thermonuclease, partial [Staphylococcus epidermidis]|nr:thermonuclease [Staphylococcus epidermidis]
MNSKKNLTIIVLAIIVIGVLAFQFLNHTGPFKDDSQH